MRGRPLRDGLLSKDPSGLRPESRWLTDRRQTVIEADLGPPGMSPQLTPNAHGILALHEPTPPRLLESCPHRPAVNRDIIARRLFPRIERSHYQIWPVVKTGITRMGEGRRKHECQIGKTSAILTTFLVATESRRRHLLKVGNSCERGGVPRVDLHDWVRQVKAVESSRRRPPDLESRRAEIAEKSPRPVAVPRRPRPHHRGCSVLDGSSLLAAARHSSPSSSSSYSGMARSGRNVARSSRIAPAEIAGQ